MPDRYDAYLARVMSDQDRALLDEAARCARGNAFRAAYLISWLSVAESLKRRFKELAPLDNEALKITQKVDRAEADHRATDRLLLDGALDYGFLSESEHSRLFQIYTRRSIYAHPYEEAPTEEVVVAAMSEAVDLVLSRPTYLREAYVQRQIAILTERPDMLDDTETAVRAFAEHVVSRVDPSLHQHFVLRLLQKLEPLSVEPDSAQLFQRGIWFLRAYLGTDDDIIAGMDHLDLVTNYPSASSLVLGIPRTWKQLDELPRNAAFGALRERGLGASLQLRALVTLREEDVLSTRERERFRELMLEVPLEHLAESGIRLRHYVEQVRDDLRSHVWPTQNPAATAVQQAGPAQIGELLPEVQEDLGRNVLQSAEGNAFSSISLLRRIASQEDVWPATFIRGIVLECFANELHQIRFKTNALAPAIGCVPKIDDGDPGTIITEIVNELRSKAIDEFTASGRDGAIRILDNIDIEGVGLDGLVAALRGLEVIRLQ